MPVFNPTPYHSSAWPGKVLANPADCRFRAEPNRRPCFCWILKNCFRKEVIGRLPYPPSSENTWIQMSSDVLGPRLPFAVRNLQIPDVQCGSEF